MKTSQKVLTKKRELAIKEINKELALIPVIIITDNGLEYKINAEKAIDMIVTRYCRINDLISFNIKKLGKFTITK